MTRTEFFDWLVFLRMEKEEHGKMDYYLAQIAAEVRRTRVKHPNQVKTKDLLLRTTSTTVVPTPEKRSASKSIWLSALKVKEPN